MSAPEGQELVRFWLAVDGSEPPVPEYRGTLAKCGGCAATLLVHPRGVKVLVPPPPPKEPPPVETVARPTRRVGGLPVPDGWTSADIAALESQLGLDDDDRGPAMSGPQPGGHK